MQNPFALFFYKFPKYFLSSWIHVIQSCSGCFVQGPNCCLRFSFYFDPLVSKRLLTLFRFSVGCGWFGHLHLVSLFGNLLHSSVSSLSVLLSAVTISAIDETCLQFQS